MNLSLLWNIALHPRSTILGLVGSCSAGAAVLYLLNAMHCDLTLLTWQALTEAGALISAPAVVGGAMRDHPKVQGPTSGEVRTEGDAAHDQAGQG